MTYEARRDEKEQSSICGCCCGPRKSGSPDSKTQSEAQKPSTGSEGVTDAPKSQKPPQIEMKSVSLMVTGQPTEASETVKETAAISKSWALLDNILNLLLTVHGRVCPFIFPLIMTGVQA